MATLAPKDQIEASEQEAHEARKRAYLAASFGSPIGNGVRRRLVRECRAFIYFLLILITLTLVEYFAIEPLVLVEGAKSLLLDTPLPSSVSATSQRFADVESTADVNLYLQNTLYNAVYSATDSGFLNTLNSVLGGVRIRQLRTKANYCNNTVGTITSFGAVSFDCYQEFGTDSEDTAAFGSSSQYTWTSAQANGAVAFGTEHKTFSSTSLVRYGGSGYVAQLSTDRTTALAELVALNANGFYDKHTRVVFVELATYNPSINQFLNVQLMFEGLAAGQFIPQANIGAFTLFPIRLGSTKTVVLAITYTLYALYIVYFVGSELADMVLEPNMAQTLAEVPPELYRAVAYWKRPFYYFFKLTFVWELVHVANILVMVVGVYEWVLFLASSEQDEYNLNTTLSTWTNHYPFTSHAELVRQLNALNLFLSFFKLFKYMQLSVRLNILWLTMRQARPFLVGFTFMFLLVFFGFALTGFVLFGSRHVQFASTFRSIRALFGFLFGDFDYTEMRTQQPMLAPLFFYGFLIIVLFVMINIFIAILNNSFSDVSDTIDSMKFKSYVSLPYLLFGRRAERCIKPGVNQSPDEVKVLRESEDSNRSAAAGEGGSEADKPHTGMRAVSYTHLRAHETVLDLVCRLLLEKKK
eukprot:TRINITY_DN16615_c0_g1_i1.p1 TRINITY_DN16615_c0_g1~~TRINITY_DN16615_c0_g1_i1.p1  ORF type:complete len:639 (-),score=164.91 TRINITY_DN16615_c0_g1_i1:53-1969(-)